MADRRGAQCRGGVGGLLLALLVGRRPALLSIDELDHLLPGPEVSPKSGERRSYRVTVTEGPWNDWFVSVAVADERGRRIALAAKDDMSLDAVLPGLLVEAEDAIAEDFLARRRQPGWTEQMRRSLCCRLLWVRNLRRPARRRRRVGDSGKVSRHTAEGR